MDDDALIWLLILGVAGFFAYQKGLLSIIGICPPGCTQIQDMFARCQDSRIGAQNVSMAYTQALSAAFPPVVGPNGLFTSDLPFGQFYLWDGQGSTPANFTVTQCKCGC